MTTRPADLLPVSNPRAVFVAASFRAAVSPVHCSPWPALRALAASPTLSPTSPSLSAVAFAKRPAWLHHTRPYPRDTSPTRCPWAKQRRRRDKHADCDQYPNDTFPSWIPPPQFVDLVHRPSGVQGTDLIVIGISAVAHQREFRSQRVRSPREPVFGPESRPERPRAQSRSRHHSSRRGVVHVRTQRVHRAFELWVRQ